MVLSITLSNGNIVTSHIKENQTKYIDIFTVGTYDN